MKKKEKLALRLIHGLRARHVSDKKDRNYRKPHATGGLCMPINAKDTKKLKQIIASQQDTYGKIIGYFEPNILIKHNSDKVPVLLDIIDSLIENESDFVIVPDVRACLPAFEDTFKQKPFYVLSIDAPDISFAFSETINSLTKPSRNHRNVVKNKEFIQKMLDGAQHKAVDYNTQLHENIESIQAKGFKKTKDIVHQLNEQGFKTRRGEEWDIHNFYRAQKQISKIRDVNHSPNPS